VLAVAVGVAVGVGIDVLRTGGLEPWLARRFAGPPVFVNLPPYVALGRSVTVDGRGVYLDCRGAGSPTVILEAGFGAGAGSWGSLLDDTAGVTRTCSWDRPGIGRSEARGLHTGGEAVADLAAALRAAGERGPYVVVAHSLGGVYAHLFSARVAADGGPGVAAFVMIDTYEPLLGAATDPALPDDLRAEIQRSLDGTGQAMQAGEDLDWAATMAELEALGPVTLPALLLMTEPRARFGDPSDPKAAALTGAWERGMARRYPAGEIELVPGAGHLIHFDRPELVAARVRDVVLEVRARAAP
jgi:pimeloyl-ACP methyl ester carboxylesterase